MTNTVDTSLNRLAYDMSGLSNLKRQATNGSMDGIKQVAQQFESVFVNMMMQSMRKAVPEGGLFSNSGMQLFTSMFDQQIAQQASTKGKGLGLTEMLIKQMSPKAAQSTDNTQQGNNVQASSQRLNNQLGQPLFSNLSSNIPPKALGQILYQGTKQQPTTYHIPEKLSEQKEVRISPSETATNFINEWLEPAKQVGQKSGIPYEVIIAQAALETGWGQKPIKTNDDKPSYNYFGIKANSSWKGNTVDVTTREYVNGKETKVNDSFRTYDSPKQALEDYARLLTENSRYQSVKNASDAHEAAQILQDNNYATDPNYANKLIQLINRIKSTENDTLTQANFSNVNLASDENYKS